MAGWALVRNRALANSPRESNEPENGGHQLSNVEICSGQSTTNLFLEHFFDLSDSLLNFAGVSFDVAFGL
jgi:hypothetical protein